MLASYRLEASPRSAVERRARLLVLPVAHFVVGIVPVMVVGFFLDQWFEHAYPMPWNGGFFFMTMLLGLPAGLFAGWWLRQWEAVWTWVPALLWFAHELPLLYFWPPHGRWQYFLDTYFGTVSQCAGSECLYEWLATTPLIAALLYSLGVWLALRLRAQGRDR